MTRRRVRRSVAAGLALSAPLLLAACAAGYAPAPTTVAAPPPATAVSTASQLVRITLEATTSGTGTATATFAGDPSRPGTTSVSFRGSWRHEFDVPRAQLADIGYHPFVSVKDRSGSRVTGGCRVLVGASLADEESKTGRRAEMYCEGGAQD